MCKSKPVIIFLSIQLIIAVSLALINPAKDFIIRQKGTEYTFSVDDAWFTGDFTEYVEANCFLDFRFDFNRFDYYTESYGIIETDENGVSYIASLSHTAPESGNYLGTEEKYFGHWGYYSSERIDCSIAEKKLGYPAWSEDYNFFADHEITVRISVYKGETVLNAFLVDGVEIEEYMNN